MPLPGFASQLREHIQKSSYRSNFKELAQLSGVSPAWISTLMNQPENIDQAKNGPGFFNLVALCNALGITPNALVPDLLTNKYPITALDTVDLLVAQIKDEILKRGNEPSLEDLIRAHYLADGVYEKIAHYHEFIDVYKLNQDELRPLRLGKHNLVAKIFGKHDIQVADYLLQEAKRIGLYQALLHKYQLANQAGIHVSIEHLDEHNSDGQRVSLAYIRLLLKAHDQTNGDVMLNRIFPVDRNKSE